ncbi:NAC domain-containing protein 40-like [Mangifera indica]|uniref:NAC domain-containing protein 40-like n=1 Tax=Mangifera indica TaxID=29780 RepID=UPI001CFA9B0E|nr:NAC domain-containing protein 40-like [Mangifera indica]
MAEGGSREMEMSIAASSMFPGFRFSPTDVELISFYLKKKMEGSDNCVEVISEIEICKYEPWDLPAKSIIKSDNEWFFFCARGRKYPNGSQSKRATELGYWKATGKERNVKLGNNVIGTKRTLVFHIGRAPKGERTEWIMHEYCMAGSSQDSLVVCRLRKNSDFHLNNTPNQASRTRRNPHSICTASGGTEVTETSEGDKGVESCSKKCSSSHDSYSIEQTNSINVAELKLVDDVNLTASSSHQKDTDINEDLFAEILKDDIIKLDETSFSTTLNLSPMVGNDMEAERNSQQPASLPAVPFQGTANEFLAEYPFPGDPSQGTANRRIKLGKHKLKLSRFGQLEIKTKSHNTDQSHTCFLTIFSSMSNHERLVSVVFCILTLLALVLFLFRGFIPSKMSYLLL